MTRFNANLEIGNPALLPGEARADLVRKLILPMIGAILEHPATDVRTFTTNIRISIQVEPINDPRNN
jgi:hypothetical protein